MDTIERVELADLAALEAVFPDGVRGKRIHAVGAGGHGISAGLLVAHARGALVTGCDHIPTPLSEMLCREGALVTVGHDPAHVAGCDLVVTNPAVTFLHPNHPELAAARALGIPVSQWQPLLGLLMRGLVGVSVAGVHGKGSTTALLGAMLIAEGLEPTVEVGDVVREWNSNVKPGQGRIFVNEADEFNYNFLSYHPRMVVLTEVEYDHPEFFRSYEEIRDAFVQFLRGMDISSDGGVDSLPPTIVTSADSPGCRDTLAQLPADWPGVVRTFSVEGSQANATASNVQVGEETSFELTLDGALVGRVALRLAGRHNVANAVAAAAAASALGVSAETIVRVLSGFEGLKRRFEIIDDGEVTWVDDYAHHPHAVALTIATARQRFPGRRIIAVFQPTLYTRLQRFLAPFAEAMAAGDEAVVVEIQPSRERDTGIIHGRDLVQAIQQQPAFAHKQNSARYGGDFAETAALLNQLRLPGDVMLVMGSGPVNQVIDLARGAASR
jgi:UDP-N-acetylmuramate--alanine ligase